MKNNKGFAISTMIYALIILFLIIVTVIMTYISSGTLMFRTIQKSQIESINKREDSLPQILVTRINDYLTVGDSFSVMDGVVALDYKGNDITDRIVVTPSIVDTSKKGVTYVTYIVTDDFGNVTELVRKISVASSASSNVTFSLDTSIKTIENFNLDYNTVTDIAGDYVSYPNSTWVKINVANDDGQIKYFKYRISKDGGETFTDFYGAIPSLSTTDDFTLHSSDNGVLIGKDGMEIFDGTSMYMSGNIYSSSEQHVSLSLYNDEYDRVLDSAFKDILVTNDNRHYEFNFTTGLDSYFANSIRLYPANYYISTDVTITDLQINPVDTYSVLLNSVGDYIIEVLVVDKDGIESLVRSPEFNIKDHTNYGPTSYKAYITDLNSTGFTINVTGVSDLTGISKVVAKIYTEANGTDDLESNWMYMNFEQTSPDTFKRRINFSNHNNEKGLYRGIIYGVNNQVNASILYDESILVE